MPLWDLDNPPVFKNPKGKPAVATERGWVDPDTGEVLVAISDLTTKAGPADALSVAFGAASYAQGDAITVIVHFNEKVDVVIGATVEVAWSGTSGNFLCTAAAQDGVYDVVFSGTVPSENGTASIAAQSVLGTITDDLGAAASNLAISASAAAAAGTRVVPAIAGTITAAAFDAGAYSQGDPISVDVTFSENVDVTAGATLDVTWTGVSGNFTLAAAEQLNTATATFTGTVPSESGTLSLDAQTIVGTVTDVNDSAATDLTVSSAVATAAGSVVVA